MSLESKAHVSSFPPPIEEDYLRTVISIGESEHITGLVSLTLKRADVMELNLRTNDNVLLVIQNNSSVLGRYHESDTLKPYPLRALVRAKVTSIDTNDGHRVYFIIEGVPLPAAEGELTLTWEDLTKLAPAKNSILTIIIAKKYRSPNKM
jgi:hypothetical protein